LRLTCSYQSESASAIIDIQRRPSIMAVSAPRIIQVTIPATNYARGRARAIDQITFHHIVGDAAAAIARFKINGEQASSTYVIASDGTIYQLVAEGDTPYTDGNFTSNSRSITIEHAGGHPNVPYTAAMYAASAHLVAWIRSRRNITRYERHRNVSDKPTACPGTLNVEGIVDQSTKILQGGTMAVDSLSKEEVIEIHRAYFIGDPGTGYGYEHVGKPLSKIINDWKNSSYRQNVLNRYWAFDTNQKTIATLNAQVTDLNKMIQQLKGNDDADKKMIADLQKAADQAQALANDLQKKNDELALEKEQAVKTRNLFTRWIGDLINKISGVN
jgi:hypothetical protein